MSFTLWQNDIEHFPHQNISVQVQSLWERLGAKVLKFMAIKLVFLQTIFTLVKPLDSEFTAVKVGKSGTVMKKTV